MPAALVSIAVRPYRMLDRREAANYCGLGFNEFASRCPVHPVALPGGKLRWDVRDVDKWLDELKMGGSESVEALIQRLG